MGPLDSSLSCEICLEPFDSQCRLPKLLPCGHSFCENCVFSLCLHSEYYLLETIKCPKCGNMCDSKLALNAPTNYDLCAYLDNLRSTKNVTVIHVPDAHSSTDCSQVACNNPRQARRRADHCFDCRRSVALAERNMICRFCEECHSTARTLRVTCLECCVNYHNGHSLKQIDELERHHTVAAEELNKLEEHVRSLDMDFQLISDNVQIDAQWKYLLEMREKCKLHLLGIFVKSKCKLENECPVSPSELRAMQRNQLQCLVRLQRFNSTFNKSMYPLKNDITLSLHDSQMAVILSGLDLLTWTIPSTEFEERLIKLNSPGITVDEKCDLLVHCLTYYIDILVKQPNSFLLEFVEDMAFKIYACIRLSAAMIRPASKALWSKIRWSYVELMRLCCMSWSSADECRIVFVEDLSFLCRLYSDVCDSGTLTLCVVECARSRRALRASGNKKLLDRLSFTEECLLECRRAHKLKNICVKSKRLRNRKQGGIREWLRCLAPQVS